MKAETNLRMCARLCAFLVWLCLSATAAGEVVIQRWGVGKRVSHSGSIRILDAGGSATVIQVDLANLAKGHPKVHSARLLAQREDLSGADDEAMVKLEVYSLAASFKEGSKPSLAGESLKLIPPWHSGFDATAAVRRALSKGGRLELYVKAFPKWRKDATELEIAYEGKLPAELPPPVGDVQVLHRAGQTFITWKEIEEPFGNKPVTLAELKRAREQREATRRIRYRVYRHDKPVTAGSIAKATLLAEVVPFSGFNVRGVCLNQLIYQHQLRAMRDSLFARKIARGPFGGYRPDMPQMGEVVVPRLAIEDGRPLPPGTGVYVHHPAEAGRAYYAVVTAIDGTANTKAFAALAEPVAEKSGCGEPVLQRVEDLKVFYDYPGERRRYVQWCAPPLANLPNQYYNWGVYVPAAGKEDKSLALGVFFHDWQNLYLKPRWPHPKDMILIAPHDGLPTFAYGYHEAQGTLRPFSEGSIHDYTARRIDAFVEWSCQSFSIDKARMSCHGSGAYGGSSAIAYALRHGQQFALVVAGAFDANPRSVQPIIIGRRRLRTHLKALEAVWGKKDWDLKTTDGKSIWKDRDMVAFVAAHPELHLPFMSLGTGSQHSTWPQENALLKALMVARQPFRTDFTWGGQAPHFGPTYVRRDRLMLAAVPTEGELKKTSWYNDAHWQQSATGYWGGGRAMINMGMRWEIDDIVDTPDRLEVSGYASGRVTLRNVQAFRLKPGEKVRWEVKTGRRAQDKSGAAAADEHGLLTVPGFRGRLIVSRAAGEQTRKERKDQ